MVRNLYKSRAAQRHINLGNAVPVLTAIIFHPMVRGWPR